MNNRPSTTVACAQCGQIFSKPTYDVQRSKTGLHYCSYTCSQAAKRRTITKPCEHCGEPFTRPPSLAHQRFCSIACRSPIGNATLTCVECGVQFVRKQYKADQRHCSMKCRDVGRTIKTQCLHCNKPIQRAKSLTKRRNRFFCSKVCAVAHLRGANNDRWRGGSKKYYGPDWKPARKAALVRANYTCQRCGLKKNGLKWKLHVHHKIPVRYFSNPNDAHFPSNLVTLCSSCHSKAERKGYKELPLFDQLTR